MIDQGVCHNVTCHLAMFIPYTSRFVLDTSPVQVGAGVGLTGAALAALGVQLTVLTDCEVAMPLLLRNQEQTPAGSGNCCFQWLGS